jgi:hypothetical protein
MAPSQLGEAGLALPPSPWYLDRERSAPAMNDLGLDIRSFTGTGRKPAPLSAFVLREIGVEDLETLMLPSPEVAEIKRLSERHHALARALAQGLSEGEAAALTGYDPSRVSVLKASPAFRELLDLYRDKADVEFAEIAGRLAGLTKDALLVLQDRLEDSPEEITTGQLLEIAKMGADRSGFGPSAKVETNININLGARLAEARKRLAPMRDITPEAE